MTQLAVVTGANSFIGKHLVKKLKEESDVLELTKDNFDFFDINDNRIDWVQSTLSRYHPEDITIYHLAGLGSSTEDFSKFSSIDFFLKSNYMTNMVLLLAKQNPGTKLVLASSVGADSIRSGSYAAGYDGSKRYMEILQETFPEIIRSVKLASVFGEDMDISKERLIPNIIKGCKKHSDFFSGREHPIMHIETAVDMLITGNDYGILYTSLGDVWDSVEKLMKQEQEPGNKDKILLHSLYPTVKEIQRRLKK